MFSWDADVLILSNNQLTMSSNFDVAFLTILNVITSLNDISPFLCAWTRYL